MRTLVNGREGAGVDPQDRGLHYGDGLFETIAVPDGRPRFLDWHFERLREGARRLELPLPALERLRDEIASVCPAGPCVVKLIFTRGPGRRGYRPPLHAEPCRIVMASAWPAMPAVSRSDGVRVRWCRMRLARNPALAGLKHLNRLEQVLARAEWDDDEVEEGLMLDERELAISGTQTNVFARLQGRWVTPSLGACGVAGVMRRAFRAWAQDRGDPVIERELPAADLASATALALTNAVIGAWPVRELAGRALAPDPDIAAFNAWLAGK
jgi:4-amino-4-deoxychorismate lyase